MKKPIESVTFKGRVITPALLPLLDQISSITGESFSAVDQMADLLELYNILLYLQAKGDEPLIRDNMKHIISSLYSYAQTLVLMAKLSEETGFINAYSVATN